VADTLFVYWADKTVGRLTRSDDNRLSFQYDAAWLSADSTAPLSARLPLQDTPFTDSDCRCFFGNLLPESLARTQIAQRLGISDSNDFGLLKAIGGDCAGALSLWPDTPPENRSPSYDPLATEQLDHWLDDMQVTPLISPNDELRISLAGAQQKIAVMQEGDRLFLPRGSAASSHIFKPDIERFPGSAVNEAFCMTLAKKVGLTVPDVRIWRSQKHVALIVARYDRRLQDGHWQRLHQEDFCQALGIPYSQKYEGDGGPGFHQLFQLLETHSTQPILDKSVLLSASIFNACIGNMDAHAKNFSMLIEPGSYRLSPFYDLLSTRIYGSLSPKLAMKIGGQARPEWLTTERWNTFAKNAGVGSRAVFEKIKELSESIPAACASVRQTIEPSPIENTTLDKLIRYITSSCSVIRKRLDESGPVDA